MTPTADLAVADYATDADFAVRPDDPADAPVLGDLLTARGDMCRMVFSKASLTMVADVQSPGTSSWWYGLGMFQVRKSFQSQWSVSQTYRRSETGRALFPSLRTHPIWCALNSERRSSGQAQPASPPQVQLEGTWQGLFNTGTGSVLNEFLPAYVEGQRWFGAKAQRISSTAIDEVIPVLGLGASAAEQPSGFVCLVRIKYTAGSSQIYLLAFGATFEQRSGDLTQAVADTAIARLRTKEGDWILFDALWNEGFDTALLEAIRKRRQLPGREGRLIATPTKVFEALAGDNPLALEPKAIQGEQSNTSVVFGDRLFFKLFRRPEKGVNPDLEIGRFLTERAGFRHVPAVAGALEYRHVKGEPMTFAILQELVPNSGDAWHYTLDTLGRFFEQAILRRHKIPDPPMPHGVSLLETARMEPPQLARDTMTNYLERARLLGRRTAELHLALASDSEDPAFAPEPTTPFYQRLLFQTMRSITVQNFRLLRDLQEGIPEAAQILDLETEILQRLRRVLDTKIHASRIRCHGDYHLGQVLCTGKDFVITDFEGEPARPLTERRIKRSPFQDVAGMLRSFHYAAYSSLYGRLGGIADGQDPSALEHWVRFWYLWSASSFLGTYLKVAGEASFIPTEPQEAKVLLDTFLLGKAVYELGYEANNRPEWIKIPIQGILHLLEHVDPSVDDGGRVN